MTNPTPHPDSPDPENILLWVAGQGRINRVKPALTQIEEYYTNKLLEAIDCVEVDREATEKHIRAVLNDEEEIDRRILDMNIEADDRHDTLDDVRTAIKQLSKRGEI